MVECIDVYVICISHKYVLLLNLSKNQGMKEKTNAKNTLKRNIQSSLSKI